MSHPQKTLAACAELVADGTLIPFIGPGLLALNKTKIPASPEDLCAEIEASVRVPKRATGNMWSAAQYVESRKFRATLEAIVHKAFDIEADTNPIHSWLARVRPPLVVDSWYDDGLLKAYGDQTPEGWGWVQGVSRNNGGLGIDIWTKAFGGDGVECVDGVDPSWPALIYKPHGMGKSGSSFLMSDSDYVEVLTEIDIQSPIPERVKELRSSRGFLFLGCRFDDQLLRTFARQIMKRSQGPNFAVLPGPLTRMEQRFILEQNIVQLDLPINDLEAALFTAA